VQEGIKSGNVSETCRRHGIAPNLFYRWKVENRTPHEVFLDFAAVL
jgi:transposase-like protein